MPYPLPLTRTEAYLAYKAGVIQQSDLKPSLAVPRNGIDAWLAYWTGLASYYPIKNLGKNIIDYAGHLNAGIHDGLDVSLDDATGQITVSGQPTRGYAKIVNTYDITNLLEDGKEYTISQSAYDNKLYTQVNAIPPTGTPTYIYSTSSAKTFTVDKTTYPRYNLVIQTGAQSAWAAPQTITRTFQIEKGSSASAFEPYTGEPLILQEEEAYIAYLSGVINEYPEKCLRRVGAYLRYLISARWGRPDHPLNREELYLSLIKTQVIPSGDPSSDIEIDGTTKAAFQDLKVYGDTKQQIHTGKNILDCYDNFIPETNGIKNTIAQNGFITVYGSITNSYINVVGYTDISDRLEDGETYKVWATNPTSYVFAEVTAHTSESAGPSQYYSSKGDGVFTVDKTTYPVYKVRILTANANTWIAGRVRSITSGFQIEKGNEATSYEPFWNEQNAPTLDSESYIQVVTGRQTLNIEGKNKAIIKQDGTYTQSYGGSDNTYTFNKGELVVSRTSKDAQGGCINITNGAVDALAAEAASDERLTENGGTYTITIYRGEGEITYTSASPRIFLYAYKYDENEVATQIGGVVGASVHNKTKGVFTVTLNENEHLGSIVFYAQYVKLEDLHLTFQLEKGSDSTDYEPVHLNKLEINLGKNLFDKNSPSLVGKYLNENGGEEVSPQYSVSAYIPVEQFMSYSYSGGVGDTSYDRKDVWYDKDKNIISIYTHGASGTVIAPSGARYVRISYRTTKQPGVSDVAESDQFQFEKGSDITSYAAYKTPIELCRINKGNGSFTDSIFKEDGKWFIEKKIAKFVLDGEEAENWYFSGESVKCNNITALGFPLMSSDYKYSPSNTIGIYCNIKQEAETATSIYGGGDGVAISSGTGAGGGKTDAVYVGGVNGNYTIQQWRDYLATTNLVCYYVLKTPTKTEITDHEIIGQLEDILASGAMDKVTYIDVRDGGDNLPAKLYVEAPKYE